MVEASRSHRLASLLPGLLLTVVFGFFLVDKWDEATSVLSSPRGLLVIAAIVGGWVLAGLLLRRFTSPWVAAGILSVVAVVLAVALVLPYYRDETVVEAASDVFAGQEIQRDGAAADEADPSSTTTAPAPVPAAPPPPAAPVQITAGTLTGIDHSAAGGANLIRRPDGSRVVELLEIDVQNGPDYKVYVVPGTERRDPDGGVNLGDLRGNQGTQYYDVPPGVDAGPGWTVLIWCEAFAVPVANASQGAV